MKNSHLFYMPGSTMPPLLLHATWETHENFLLRCLPSLKICRWILSECSYWEQTWRSGIESLWERYTFRIFT